MLRVERAALAVAGAGLAVTLTAACSNGHRAAASAESTASAAAAPGVTVTDGYVREPASPDVAAAYVTLANSADAADTVTAFTADVAGSVMPMADTDGRMTTITDFDVPAHGTRKMAPGHEHLMLMKLTRTLHAGDSVRLRITFAHSGPVTVTLPVTPLLGSPGGQRSGSSGGSGGMASDMPGMPGMN